MARSLWEDLPLLPKLVGTRRLTNDDDSDDSVKESDQLLNTFYINMIIFCALLAVFELVRHWKSIYLNRLNKMFIQSNRVPPPPSRVPLAWLYTVLTVPQEEVLRMVGLDGYMLLRFLIVCFRVASFFAFFGVLVLVPIYHAGQAGKKGWNAFTVANIEDSGNAYSLWAPVVFAYLFTMFYCQLMYYEYKNFIHKRVLFLVDGDLDTQLQTNYTVLVENLPTSLKSTPMLTDFFERLFPTDVYSVEIALDLKELEALTAQRRQTRDLLEKAIASYKATEVRPKVWVAKGFYAALQAEYEEILQSSSLTGNGDCPSVTPEPLTDLLAQLPEPLPNSCASSTGSDCFDAIQHYTVLLAILNRFVTHLQRFYSAQRLQIDKLERGKLREVKQLLHLRGLETGAKQVRSVVVDVGKGMQGVLGGLGISSKSAKSEKGYATFEPNSKDLSDSAKEEDTPESKEQAFADSYTSALASSSVPANESNRTPVLSPLLKEHADPSVANSATKVLLTIEVDRSRRQDRSSTSAKSGVEGTEEEGERDSQDSGASSEDPSDSENASPHGTLAADYSLEGVHPPSGATPHHKRLLRKLKHNTDKTITAGKELAKLGVDSLAKEGIRTAEYATKGVLRGFLEATRALELLTIGSYYRIGSTAFVTFKSRVSALCCTELLLSHDHYRIAVSPAANVHDIIWENVSIPVKQIEIRRYIAYSIITIGALFWSLVVAFISAVTSLESISQEIPALRQYSNTEAYIFFNYYLAIGILLILLSLLPFVFDFIARSYEGVKFESEVQSSILHRYFNYQMANVFVAVGLGSVATSLHQILDNPSSILSILGSSVASFSIYFANLLITRTFTGIPIEMLRIFNLLEISLVYLCKDKRKYTRRQLRTGAFADCSILYGWIYPNILMGLMIMVTYCCIAPFVLPLCMVFFGFLFLMYKYQLLYVYVNKSQSGGAMWYTLFNQSMLVLVCGLIVLVCYLAIRQAYISGPFYASLPLPVLVCFFWRNTNKKFELPAKQLSLERAKEIDRAMQFHARHGLATPLDTFKPHLYRQPSLAEKELRPAPYRYHVYNDHHDLTHGAFYRKYANRSSHKGSEGGSDPQTPHSLDRMLVGGDGSGSAHGGERGEGQGGELEGGEQGAAAETGRDDLGREEENVEEEEGEGDPEDVMELDREVSLFLEDATMPSVAAASSSSSASPTRASLQPSRPLVDVETGDYGSMSSGPNPLHIDGRPDEAAARRSQTLGPRGSSARRH